MHKRIDHPELDPAQQHRQLVGGLDRVWTGLDPERPVQRPGDGGMIELVSEERCIKCDACIRVCPTNVFEHGPTGYP